MTDPPAGYDEYAYGNVCKENILYAWYYGDRKPTRNTIMRYEAEKIKPKSYMPEHRLMLAILHRALVDCRDKALGKNEETITCLHEKKRKLKDIELRDWAEVWFEQENVDYLYSLENICNELDLSVDTLRRLVKKMIAGEGPKRPHAPKLPS